MHKVQYKSFFFPHNPASISIECPGRHAVLFRPSNGEIVQSLGKGTRKIVCTGSFLAPTATEAADIVEDFLSKTSDPSPGYLILPEFGIIEAVLCETRFEASGDGRAIAYTMRFLEVEVKK